MNKRYHIQFAFSRPFCIKPPVFEVVKHLLDPMGSVVLVGGIMHPSACSMSIISLRKQYVIAEKAWLSSFITCGCFQKFL